MGPQSQQQQVQLSSPVLLPHEVLHAVAYAQSPSCDVYQHLQAQMIDVGEHNSPTSIADHKLFTHTSSDQSFMEPLKPAMDAAGNLSFLSNSIVGSDYSPSLESTSSEHSSSDDERYDPISSELDLLNDDFALDGQSYLGLLFDEPMVIPPNAMYPS